MPPDEATPLAQTLGPTPVQVHVAPQILAFDERAPQIFHRFATNPAPGFETLRSTLLRRYPPNHPASANPGSQDQQALASIPPTDSLHLPPARTDHPGGLYGLVWVVDRLLGPAGCPWDIQQTHHTLKKYLLEEAYELIQAIDDDNDEAMREELGDVLLQPLMHTQKKEAAGAWGIEEVTQSITEKLVRRHPHVFGETQVADADEVLRNWDAIKQSEKPQDNPRSILAGIPASLPALHRALEVSKRAARAGFEWPDIESVWDKFREEEREVQEALAQNNREAIRDEFGDLLFTVVNLARWANVDPEDALRTMVARFQSRFENMEARAPKPLAELTPEEWDNLWNTAKAHTHVPKATSPQKTAPQA